MSVAKGAVLVTGASTGIGLAVTQRLAARGTPVLAGVRNDADAARIGAINGVEPLILDVVNADHIGQLAQRLALPKFHRRRIPPCTGAAGSP